MIIKSRLLNHAFAEKGIANIVKWEVFPVKNTEIKITFESINSSHRQGIFLRADEGVQINDSLYPSVFLWFDTSPKNIILTPKTSSGFCEFYNIWDRNGRQSSQSLTSGMIAEEIPNGFRYRCNDIGLETDFSSLIFTVENLKSE